jgi:hypothetical protein
LVNAIFGFYFCKMHMFSKVIRAAKEHSIPAHTSVWMLRVCTCAGLGLPLYS